MAENKPAVTPLAVTLHGIWLNVIKSKKLRSKIKGKQALILLDKLLEKYPFDDILKVFHALKPQSNIELYELLNPATFNKYLEAYQKGLTSPIFTQDYARQVMVTFLHRYVYPQARNLFRRKLTYLEFLLSLPTHDDVCKWWLVVDDVFSLVNRHKLIPKDKIRLYRQVLTSYYRKRSWREKMRHAYEYVLSQPEVKPLKDLIQESVELIQEQLNDEIG